MQQIKHADDMVARFRELVEDSGDSLSVNHYNELRLIIEAGLNTAIMESMEHIADRLDSLSKEIRRNANMIG